MRLLIIGLSVITIYLVFYLSWLSNPDVGDVLPTPTWISQWVNANGNIRTAVPFIFLGGLAELGLCTEKNKSIGRGWVGLGLLAVVTMAEVGQLWIPQRHFDVWDIVCGGLGTILGMIMTNVCLKNKVI